MSSVILILLSCRAASRGKESYLIRPCGFLHQQGAGYAIQCDPRGECLVRGRLHGKSQGSLAVAPGFEGLPLAADSARYPPALHQCSARSGVFNSLNSRILFANDLLLQQWTDDASSSHQDMPHARSDACSAKIQKQCTPLFPSKSIICPTGMDADPHSTLFFPLSKR